MRELQLVNLWWTFPVESCVLFVTEVPFFLSPFSLCSPHFEDEEHFKVLVKMTAQELSNGIPDSGHNYALIRASRTLTLAGELQEMFHGMEQVKWEEKGLIHLALKKWEDALILCCPGLPIKVVPSACFFFFFPFIELEMLKTEWTFCIWSGSSVLVEASSKAPGVLIENHVIQSPLQYNFSF